jgi:membrane-anchored protein YejM (alkaline phosphatase superfamily)
MFMRRNKGNTMRDVEKEKEMCSFLEKKLDQFKEYQSITERMKQTVCGNDENNELFGLIHRRQKCINDIEKINSSIDKLMKSGSIKFSSISKKYKGLVESCLSSIKDVMIQVDLMDKELVTIVSERGESIKTEILNMRNMRQAARGYQASKRYPAKFLDTRR